MSNQLPEGWKICKISDVCCLKGGNGFNEQFQGNSTGDYPFIKVSDMNHADNTVKIVVANNWVDKTIFDSQKWNLFPSGAVVFAKVGAALLLNRRRILTRDTCIDNNMMSAIPNDKVLSDYLYTLLLTIDFAKLVQDGAVPSVNQSQVGELQIMLPPIEEQRKIAAILGTVDEKINGIDRRIKEAENLKKGLMQKLFSEGIGHTEFKTTELGTLPASWEVTKLASICDVRDGTHDTPKYIKSGIPLVTSKNLKNGYIDFSDCGLISLKDHEAISKRSQVDDGDIIFGMIGTIGNPVIVKKSMEFSIKNVALLKFSSRCRCFNTYILYLLGSPLLMNHFSRLSNGGVQSFVSLGMIRAFNIPLPPIEEQKKIAEILTEADNKIEHLKKLKDKYVLLKKGLMQQLLTGQKRVEV